MNRLLTLFSRKNFHGYIIDKRGQKNTIHVSDKAKVKHTKIKIRGNGNTIYIGPSCEIENVELRILGDNCTIRIEGGGYFHGGEIIIAHGSGSRFYLGKNSTIEYARFRIVEGQSIDIGEDCMISWDCYFFTSDMHSILDMETGSRLNPSKSISLGKHVWIGRGVTISKGVSLTDNIIVGGGSFVSKSFAVSGAVIAGSPAKQVSLNRTWDRSLI